LLRLALVTPEPHARGNANSSSASPTGRAKQAAKLKQLAQAAYERDAFKPNLTRAEADLRIAALAAKLKLLSEPPHTL
jgi:hypothetical protein